MPPAPPLCQESVYGGPQFFNSAVKALIEGMPRSEECEKYEFAAMRGRGTVPMFKKVAVDWQAAAERAEEKMRRELEKSWWTGMPEAEKVGAREGVGVGGGLYS